MTATVRPRIPATVLVLALATWLISISNLGIASASASTMSASSYAARLAQLVNNARAEHGVRTLTIASGTTSVAASWTSQLAAQGSLSHNPHLFSDLVPHGSRNARVAAENVGGGAQSDPQSLFRAYMNSPEHRSNILDSDVHYLGIAVVYSGSSYAWNTMDFVDSYGSTSTARASTRTAPVHHSQVTHHASTARHTSTTSRPKAAAPRPRAVPKAAPAAAAVHRSPALLQAKDADLRAAAVSSAAYTGVAVPAPVRTDDGGIS